MWEMVLGLLAGLFKAIPYFDRWFSKTPIEKEADAEKKAQDEMDRFKNSGRPPQ